ncbi:heptaprenyl diphosphate synthase component II [Priestia endophytica]|jgi:heptaprenyl diphosphate synthase|uniref:heptaprenyl diphosphate synthase component II n=1 Tax=Priestia endophytica TaxID=135735 RepID=UPI000F532787|nr:heptaprenyl diphosphate synthase component II [Priestia endophytica]MED4070364.1 heptaprenyl diphosphate synthase component II [Priestia endophytica]RPK15544.1 Heptaprenyl diphosphate synthase component II [Priestia endophytica]
MKLQMIYAFLHGDISRIEKELEEAIEKENTSIISEASLQLLQAGGKRIRPVFVLLGAKFGDYDIENIKNVAMALELIHMASLVHDDVVDDSDVRRGQPTIKAKWDNRIAMYTGDYILGRSLELMTKIPDVEAHKVLSHAIVEVCLGEIEQIKDKYDLEQNVRTYFRRIKRKTALLIAVSCQLGAIAAGADKSIHERLYWFGYYVGMSFQITDDILDFTSSEKQLGKPAGSDLLQGNITLPMFYALEMPGMKEQVEKLFAGEHDRITAIIEDVKRSGSIEKATKISDLYLDKALAVLDELPPSKAKNTYNRIAKFIGKRKF